MINAIDTLVNRSTYKRSCISLKNLLGNSSSKGKMVVLSSLPEIDKTSFALNLISNSALIEKKNVLLISMKNDYRDVERKILSISSDMNITLEKLKKDKLIICSTSGLTSNELEDKIIDYSSKSKIDLIVIDYLQLMKLRYQKHKQKQIELKKILLILKQISKELSTTIIVLSQIDKELEASGINSWNHYYMCSPLEKIADISLSIYINKQEKLLKDKIEADLVVINNNNNKRGSIILDYYPTTNIFKINSGYKNGVRVY